MIIDMHTHIFPDKIAKNAIKKLSQKSGTTAFTDGTLNGLERSMKESGIDISVILPVATNSEQVKKINDVAAELNKNLIGKIISLGSIHPDYENYSEELQRLKELDIKGIKIHPVYQDTDLDDIKYLRIFECAAKLDLIVVTHAGLDIGYPGVVRCSPKMARRVVDEIGNFKFVLAHMGGWQNWKEVPEYLADTNVYIDTAFTTGKIVERTDIELMNAEQFIGMIKIFGSDRILFGTDSPWTSQSESMKFIKCLQITEEDKEKILGKNALNLLKHSKKDTRNRMSLFS